MALCVHIYMHLRYDFKYIVAGAEVMAAKVTYCMATI